MNIFKSIMNLFSSSETKRRGKYADKTSIAEIRAKHDKLLNEINKGTGQTDFLKYKESFTFIQHWIGDKQ